MKKKAIQLVTICGLATIMAAADAADSRAGVLAISPCSDELKVAIDVTSPDGTRIDEVRMLHDASVAGAVLVQATSETELENGVELHVAQILGGPSEGWSTIDLSEVAQDPMQRTFLVLSLAAADGQASCSSGISFGTNGSNFRTFVGSESMWNEIVFSLKPWVEVDYGAPGSFVLSSTSGEASLVAAGEEPMAPAEPQYTTALLPGYPNPFNPSTALRFTLAEPARVDMSVYDVRGARVWNNEARVYATGHHEVRWNGTDHAGQSVGTGVYFVRMRAGERDFSRRVILLK